MINYLKSNQRIIQGFSKLATLLILILKTIRSFKALAPKVFRIDDNKIISRDSDSKTNKIVKNICLSLVNTSFRL